MTQLRAYYMNTEMGCSLGLARDIRQARKFARDEAGRCVVSVRRATEDDKAWVGAMGGRVPNGTYDKGRN